MGHSNIYLTSELLEHVKGLVLEEVARVESRYEGMRR
ncbi:hypothetical protein T09_8323 [Trichinella sp. T9]|nr:hypothetical protein T09_8323 [Trichinella sp. T9]